MESNWTQHTNGRIGRNRRRHAISIVEHHRLRPKTGQHNKNPSFNLKTIIKLVTKRNISLVCFSILCLIGCIYHVTSLFGVFFAYPTTVNVKFEEPDEVEVPATTICTPLLFAAKRSKFS